MVRISSYECTVAECPEGSILIISGLIDHERLGEDSGIVFLLCNLLNLEGPLGRMGKRLIHQDAEP